MARIPIKIPKNENDNQAGTLWIDTDRNSPLFYMDGMFKAGNIPEGWINVKDFGAVGDGNTDDTTSIQNAIDNTPTNGNLYFPKGTYLISSSLNISKEIHIFSNHATLKISTNNPILNITQYENVTISNLDFDLENSQIGILIDPGTWTDTKKFGAIIEDCSFILNNSSIGIELDHINQVYIHHCNFTGNFTNEVGIKLHESINTFITDNVFRSLEYGVYHPGTGLATEAGTYVSNCTILGCYYGVYFDSIDYFHVNDSMIDYNDIPITILSTNGKINNCFISSRNNHPAIIIDIGTDGSKPEHVWISQNHIITHTTTDNVNAIEIYDGATIDITDNIIRFYSKHGIYLDKAVDHLRIIANRFAGDKSRNYEGSIYLSADNSNYIIAHNQLEEGSSTPALTSTFAKVGQNYNYPTINYGQAILPSGNTTLEINHGLSKTPRIVLVSPNQLGLGSIRVINFSSTSFTIQSENPAPADTTIYWLAITNYALL